jgi:hypothetical protein
LEIPSKQHEAQCARRIIEMIESLTILYRLRETPGSWTTSHRPKFLTIEIPGKESSYPEAVRRFLLQDSELPGYLVVVLLLSKQVCERSGKTHCCVPVTWRGSTLTAFEKCLQSRERSLLEAEGLSSDKLTSDAAAARLSEQRVVRFVLR